MNSFRLGPITLLILVAVMPFLWGCTVHWLMSKLWPHVTRSPDDADAHPAPPIDYQI